MHITSGDSKLQQQKQQQQREFAVNHWPDSVQETATSTGDGNDENVLEHSPSPLADKLHLRLAW